MQLRMISSVVGIAVAFRCAVASAEVFIPGESLELGDAAMCADDGGSANVRMPIEAKVPVHAPPAIRRRRHDAAAPALAALEARQCRDVDPGQRYSIPDRADCAAAEFVVELHGREIALDRCEGRAPGGYYGFGSSEPGGARVWFHPATNHWVVIDAAGVRYTYGGMPESRMGFDVAVGGGTFAWVLSRVEDANGNAVDLDHRQPVVTPRRKTPPTAVSERQRSRRRDPRSAERH